MDWKKIKAMNEQRGAIVAQMETMLNAADSEKRALTAEESGKFDELRAEADSLNTQLNHARSLYDLKNIAADPNAGAFKPAFGQANTRSGAVADDTAETRALRPDESCVDFLRGRGVISGAPSISLGAYMRAIVTGARNDDERRALNETSSGAGGYTTNAALSAQFIDALRPASVVARAGAKIVPMISNVQHVARVASDPTPGWIAETDDVPESEPTFDRVTLTAKDIAIKVPVSRQLLQDSVNIEAALQTCLMGAVGAAIDAAALVGTGSSNQPTGIANTSGINSVSLGTNGAALANYVPFLNARYEIAVDNAGEPSAAIVHPRTALAIDSLTDANDNPLTRPKSIESLPFLSTTALSIAMTQGSASNASQAIVGDFSRLLIGVRLEPRIEVTPTPLLGNKLQVAFVVWARIDIAVEQPKAFAKIVGIIPAA